MTIVNPQIEDGHLKIANDIAKYLARTYMSSYETQILWAIFIKTYGFNKKEDWISNSQFVKITGIHKAHVSRTIKKLLKRKMITQTGNKIAFQKNSTLWCKLPNQVTVTQTGTTVAQTGNSVTQIGGHKRHYTKDTIQNTGKVVEKIAKWAYERARVKPQCLASSFIRIVHEVIKRKGADEVKKIFEEEDNAIRFLTRIKAL